MKTYFPEVFQARAKNTHKGTYGTVAVLGGEAGMTGAVVLASTAALYGGCGKVWAGFCQPKLPFAYCSERPEIMLARAKDLIQHTDIQAWVVGCGLGQKQDAIDILHQLVLKNDTTPLLLDAVALKILAQDPSLAYRIQSSATQRPLIMTPHPAEAARLLSVGTDDIQNHREWAVKTLSKNWNAYCVLKGYHTLVCTPNEQLYRNESGNAGLATAGSGDVLSGIIGAFLAQGIETHQAICAGVYLHGLAAEELKKRHHGEHGLLAGEIAAEIRFLRNQIVNEC